MSRLETNDRAHTRKIFRIPHPYNSALSTGSYFGSQYSASRHWRILLADDDRDAALGVAASIRNEGHEVRIAHSGRDAIAAIHDFDPDVAIVDIAMPGM